MSRDSFDERQLIERGTAYRNAYITALAGLVVYIMLDEFTGITFRLSESMNMVIFPSASAFLITAILRDAIEGINSKNSWKGIASIFIIAGISLAVCSCFDYIGWLSSSSDKNMLDALISSCFAGACMAGVGIVYWIRQIAMRKKSDD